MVRAWYIDNDSNNLRLEHHQTPPKFIAMDEVFKNCGVEYFSLNVDTYKADGLLDKIRIQRHYTYEDEVVCTKEALPEYEKTMQKFFTEHLHPDEEIRFILDGSGYFDVRDKNDEWIRIEATTGDMLVIPRGIYHRFTLDMKDFIKAKRLFSGDTPVWTAFFRPADDMQCRKDYLERMKAGFTAPLMK